MEAIKDGRFHLYAVDQVEEGIEVLTGVPAGKRDSFNHFPASSVFGRVERRLIEIAERLRQAEGHMVPPDVSQRDVTDTDLGDQADFKIR
jgi:hypothetical protein